MELFLTKDLQKPEKDKEDRYFHHMDEKGNLHLVDLHSGKIVKSAPRFEDSLVKGQHLNPVFISGNSSFWKYSDIYKDLITTRICEGHTLSSICKQPGMPSMPIMAKWRLQNDDFDLAIRGAYKARAEIRADQIAESIKEDAELPKDDIPMAKLIYEKRKWLAEKDDPDKYGNKVKHSGDSENPMIIQVSTGIDRTPLPLPEPDDVIDITPTPEEE